MTTNTVIANTSTSVAADKLLTPQTGKLAVAPAPTGGQGLSLKSTGRIPRSLVQYFNYTPVWTATGTGPSIGNGTLYGRYVKLGYFVNAEFIFKPGSSTTFGTGSYMFSVPVLAAQPTSNPNPVIGFGHTSQNSTGNLWTVDVVLITTGTFACFLTAAGGSTEIGTTTPFTYASLDLIKLNLSYESAA